MCSHLSGRSVIGPLYGKLPRSRANLQERHHLTAKGPRAEVRRAELIARPRSNVEIASAGYTARGLRRVQGLPQRLFFNIIIAEVYRGQMRSGLHEILK